MQLRFPLQSAFLAIPLEDEAKAFFGELQDRLQKYSDIFTFQKRESPHLTLQFWKELMEIEYGQVVPQCRKIAEATAPFRLVIDGIGTFGKRGDTRVLYLDVPFSEPLARLKKRCPWPSAPDESAPPGEERLFRPHITLARIKHPQRFVITEKDIQKLLKGISLSMPVKRLRLYANVDGIHQTALHEFLLKDQSSSSSSLPVA